MNVTGNETAENVTNTWENASLYYSLPSDDPDLLGCQPIILKAELQVCLKPLYKLRSNFNLCPLELKLYAFLGIE